MRELELLRHIYSASAPRSPRVRLGPGDDMAEAELDGRTVLASVDQVVGGRHFDPARTPVRLVGRKAVARSLSDIAAMAAKPVASLAAVTLPEGFGHDRATELFDAMRETAEHYGCPLIGGDIAIAAAPTLVCSVTVLAEPGPAGTITRGGARAGDLVFVTGRLGGALGPDGLGRHLTFEPRMREALLLAERLGNRLHAMIDLSDGLGVDAGHIAECSGVEIAIDADRIPCAPGIDWRRAAGDGEDYELCFAAIGDVPGDLDGLPITRIGRAGPAGASGAGRAVIRDTAGTHDGARFGWEHRG